MSTNTEETLRFNAEIATLLTVEFLKRLGYKRGLRATKVSLSEGTYVVEMALEKRTAKVQIDYASKQVKEYEIQDAESASNLASSKGKIVLIAASLIGVVFVVLKLFNIF
jgi:hypothetical protein